MLCLTLAARCQAGCCFTAPLRFPADLSCSYASLLRTLRILCCSMQDYALALLCESLRGSTIAIHGDSRLLHAFADLIYSPPGCSIALRVISTQGFSVAVHILTQLFHCGSVHFSASPLLIRSWQLYSFADLVCAALIKAVPLHITAYLCCHCFTLASKRLLPSGTGPCRCCATDQCRRTVRSPAIPARPSHGRRTDR